MGPDILRENFALLIPLMALMIPLVAIVGHYLSKSRREQALHDTIRELARAGQPIPPELFSRMDAEPEPSKNLANPNRSLVPGVVNLCVGLGLMGMFSLMKPNSWLWGIGLIPFCLGLGFLLVWNFERKQPPAR